MYNRGGDLTERDIENIIDIFEIHPTEIQKMVADGRIKHYLSAEEYLNQEYLGNEQELLTILFNITYDDLSNMGLGQNLAEVIADRDSRVYITDRREILKVIE